MIFQLKKYLYDVLEDPQSRNPVSTLLKIFMTALILLNVIAFIISTVNSIETKYENPLKLFETFSIGIFTLEYLLRIWVCTLKKNLILP